MYLVQSPKSLIWCILFSVSAWPLPVLSTSSYAAVPDSISSPKTNFSHPFRFKLKCRFSKTFFDLTITKFRFFSPNLQSFTLLKLRLSQLVVVISFPAEGKLLPHSHLSVSCGRTGMPTPRTDQLQLYLSMIFASLKAERA